MKQIIEPLNDNDLSDLAKQREWLLGHFDNPDAYSDVLGKLNLINTILMNKWVEKNETWKLQSLGVAFGDALVQEVAELFWVAVEDEFGRDPALRWLETSVTVFPLTAISKRIEDEVEVDVYELFSGFQKAIKNALDNQA